MTDNSKYSLYPTDIEKSKHKKFGYPATHLIYNARSKEGHVFIGNYYFTLSKFNTDDFSYSEIGTVMIRKGSSKEESAKEDKKKERPSGADGQHQI